MLTYADVCSDSILRADEAALIKDLRLRLEASQAHLGQERHAAAEAQSVTQKSLEMGMRERERERESFEMRIAAVEEQAEKSSAKWEDTYNALELECGLLRERERASEREAGHLREELRETHVNLRAAEGGAATAAAGTGLNRALIQL